MIEKYKETFLVDFCSMVMDDAIDAMDSGNEKEAYELMKIVEICCGL